MLGVDLPPWKGKREEDGGGGLAGGGFSVIPEHGSILVAPDYSRVLNEGLDSIIWEAEDELKNTKLLSDEAIDKSDFLRASIIANNAVIRFSGRFADLATEMSTFESDPMRKVELKRIVANCRRVPANPARTFYEALQSLWFIFLVLNPNNVLSFGRFDQYMYPFYKRDIDRGVLSREETLELLECLRIKNMQILTTGGRGQREKWSGLAKWHNMIIGGQTPEGEDATNELSYLILEAAEDCPTPHHTITARVHEKTPETFMLKSLEVVRTGIGMPAFVGDKGHIEFLLSYGIPIKLARDYTLAGCLDVNLTGRSRNCAYPMFIVPRVFDIFIHNGIDPHTGKQVGPKTGNLEDFKSFDELMTAFKKELTYFMERHAENMNIYWRTYAELYPQPVLSSLMVDGIKAGKDLLNHRLLLENAAILNAVGMINVTDSLAAIKKLVYDEKKFDMKQLQAALEANWQGNGYALMRKMFLGAPKYGNDDDYVDSIASDLYCFWAETAVTMGTRFGAHYVPSAISISAQWPGGEETGATPDGRFAGECLADGTMSAMRGMDTRGPTALIKSAIKIDQVPISTTLMNMKFHPSALKTTDDLKKLTALIKTYFSLGGKHIQFNVVSKETLLDAQQHPENYHDLIVRVAGYSAYFVQLGKVVQDEVIKRTQFDQPA
jgi:formate C-acetyltransferase